MSDEFEEEISKSIIKKEMLRLQELGERLVALPDVQLKNIPLDEQLLDAILLARKITKHGGLRRQLQYIGKLMRQIDPEPIEAALDKIDKGHQEDAEQFHLKEQWREDLLNGGNEKLTDFYNQYPTLDLQRLRQLLRSHKNAKTDEKKKQASRQVFKLVAEQIDQNSDD